MSLYILRESVWDWNKSNYTQGIFITVVGLCLFSFWAFYLVIDLTSVPLLHDCSYSSHILHFFDVSKSIFRGVLHFCLRSVS